jgi:SNF2 family DNA or RNA helicase
MSAEEKQHYQDAREKLNRERLRKINDKGASPHEDQLALSNKLHLRPAPTKAKALVKDLLNLKRKDPNMRAIVFTQYSETHHRCCQEIQSAGISTLAISGSTSASKRDQAIRQFQSDRLGAQVFVTTIRSGSVGITLTAASRVYLMEPCIDSAMEVQAAGRISRLGQTKQVEVMKYAFADSFECNILTFHEEIHAGRATMSNTLIPARSARILTRGI